MTVAGFYLKTADLIVAEMQRSGGLITHEDLNNPWSVVSRFMVNTIKTRSVLTPPSSGGVHLIQMLNMLEGSICNTGHNSAYINAGGSDASGLC